MIPQLDKDFEKKFVELQIKLGSRPDNTYPRNLYYKIAFGTTFWLKLETNFSNAAEGVTIPLPDKWFEKIFIEKLKEKLGCKSKNKYPRNLYY